jgi:hypothetical protein
MSRTHESRRSLLRRQGFRSRWRWRLTWRCAAALSTAPRLTVFNDTQINFSRCSCRSSVGAPDVVPSLDAADAAGPRPSGMRWSRYWCRALPWDDLAQNNKKKTYLETWKLSDPLPRSSQFMTQANRLKHIYRCKVSHLEETADVLAKSFYSIPATRKTLPSGK